MAKKDVEHYFRLVADQYQEMLENIRDIEKEVNDNLTDPELLDRLKAMAEPLKNNYMTLSYIMFLLNQPARKSKIKGYEKRNQKLLKTIPAENTKDGILAKNASVIDKVKSVID